MGGLRIPVQTRLVDRGAGYLVFRTESHPGLRALVVVLLVGFFLCTWFAPFSGELWFRLTVLGYGAVGILVLGKFREQELRGDRLEVRSRAAFLRRTRSLPTAGARLELADRHGRTALVLVLRDGSRETLAVSRDAGALASWAAAIGELLPEDG